MKFYARFNLTLARSNLDGKMKFYECNGKFRFYSGNNDG